MYFNAPATDIRNCKTSFIQIHQWGLKMNFRELTCKSPGGLSEDETRQFYNNLDTTIRVQYWWVYTNAIGQSIQKLNYKYRMDFQADFKSNHWWTTGLLNNSCCKNLKFTLKHNPWLFYIIFFIMKFKWVTTLQNLRKKKTPDS